MSIGSVTVRADGDVACFDLSRMARGYAEKIDGILGMDVLRRLVFSIDFDEGRLRFHSSLDATFGVRVPLVWTDDAHPGCPVVCAELDSGVTQEFLLDTGGVVTFSGTFEASIYDRLSKEGRLVREDPDMTDFRLRMFTVDASVDMKLGRARRLSLGGYTHEGAIFGRFVVNCLCLGFLSRYVVAFDFPNSVMYLRPGKAFARPDAYDLSCLVVARSGGAIVVTEAYAGGAGAAAGLRNGDAIVAIDGVSTREVSLFAFQRFLCVEGRHVLEVSRGGTQRRVVLSLDKALRDQSGAAAAPEPTHRWALLIGVDRPQRAKEFSYCGDDQRALAAQLIDNGFERDRVFLLHDQAQDGKYLPRKTNIEQQLEWLLKRVKPGDVLIVAFRGHGVQVENTTYLYPAGGNLDDPGTMISLDSVCKKLERSPATLNLLLVDACRGDARLDEGRPAGEEPREVSRGLARIGPPPRFLLLHSCSPGEAAKDDRSLRHGVFMHFVLEGLQGGADADNNRHVSLRELSDYAARKTQLHVARKFNASQRPSLRGNLNASALDSNLFALTKPGETISNTIGMKLVVVPDGEFKMGGGESVAELEQAFGELPDWFPPEWIAAEHPKHAVRITKPFYMGVNEVTKAQFAMFVEAEGYKTDAETDGNGGWGWSEKDGELAQKPSYNWRSCGFEQADDHPVVNVSFNDATAFCAWLSKREGNGYRLPTEAEWEYACRAGSTTRFYIGEDPEGLVKIGNVGDATAGDKFGFADFTIKGKDGYVFTAPVGRFPGNAFGLYDMAGNAAEWCSDYYDLDYYSKSPTDDPRGPAVGSLRVHRGGGWSYPAALCRSAFRGVGGRVFLHPDLGFRVVRVR
ncbi:MAG TPA: SUMF1/EgtB/PvdO family nonheme iron enzyme [Pirellulales bacterium]|nr:SUMF1/EgtB/PvdO family nonheme iron enzyme [Pirellulales bacterium]